MPAAIKSGVAHNKEKLKRLGTESETGKSEFRTPGTAAHMSVRNRGVCWLDLGFLTQIERLHVVPSPPPHHVEVGETSKQPTPDSSTSWAATELFSCQPPKGNCSSVCLSVWTEALVQPRWTLGQQRSRTHFKSGASGLPLKCWHYRPANLSTYFLTEKKKKEPPHPFL